MIVKPTIELHSQDKYSSYILLFRSTGTFEKKRVFEGKNKAIKTQLHS